MQDTTLDSISTQKPTKDCSGTRLAWKDIQIPAALLGSSDPLPQMLPLSEVAAPVKVDPDVPAELRTYLGYGVGNMPGDPCLPYSLQNNYTRERRPESFRVAILENEHLKATVMLDYGGRLRSLLHKASGRELVEVNPVFQPANLGIRNAWFSGGIEWNYGVRGHTPLGCEPLFAAEIAHPEGWPVLRLWEYERIRAVPFQLDFLLPPGSEFLHVRVGLSNPHAQTIPFYWWSNIAVPEAPEVRVLAPATSALRNKYSGGLEMANIPEQDGRDLTYSVRSPHSADVFFHIPDHTRPWIAALDKAGEGLIQTSTAAQRGRKLFVWGNSQGGQQWQQFLTEGNRPYIEIQAGVARTQYESFPFPAGARLGWIESYGLMKADPKTVHGSDWAKALAVVEDKLKTALPAEELEALLEATDDLFDTPPERILQHGSGWGALESLRREATGEKQMAMPGSPFPEATLGKEQRPWIHLLECGTFPHDVSADSWMTQQHWIDLLEKSDDDTWLAWLHRGVMRYHQGDSSGAKTAWQTSLDRKENYLAMRNLGKLACFESRHEEAARLLKQAHDMEPALESLAIECVGVLLETGHAAEALNVFDRMPASATRQGRLRVLKAKAALANGMTEHAAELLGADLVIADIREGETILNELWWELCAQQEAKGGLITEEIRRRARAIPVPAHLDFRQTA